MHEPAALRPRRRQPQAQGDRLRLPLHDARDRPEARRAPAPQPILKGAREPYRYEREVEEFLRWSPSVQGSESPLMRAESRGDRGAPEAPGRASLRCRRRRSSGAARAAEAAEPEPEPPPDRRSSVDDYDELEAEEIIALLGSMERARARSAARARIACPAHAPSVLHAIDSVLARAPACRLTRNSNCSRRVSPSHGETAYLHSVSRATASRSSPLPYFVFLLIAGSIGVYAYDASRDDLIADGVTVGGVHVGGMRAAEARATIQEQLAASAPEAARREVRQAALPADRRGRAVCASTPSGMVAGGARQEPRGQRHLAHAPRAHRRRPGRGRAAGARCRTRTRPSTELVKQVEADREPARRRTPR